MATHATARIQSRHVFKELSEILEGTASSGRPEMKDVDVPTE